MVPNAKVLYLVTGFEPLASFLQVTERRGEETSVPRLVLFHLVDQGSLGILSHD